MRTRDITGKFQTERKSLYKRCTQCSVSFYCRSLFKYQTAKYCSRPCQALSLSKTKRGKRPYQMTQAIRQRISDAKKGVPVWGGHRSGMEWVKGENNKNWKGGVTSYDIKERKRFKATLQKQVFQRDNYTCQMCEATGDLQVDHIQSWSEYVDMRFSLENCRTLCKSCHYFVTYGKKIPDPKMAWGHNLGRRVAP